MIVNDIMKTAIDYAFEVAIEKHVNDDGQFIYRTLCRSREIWENIRFHGLQVYGMSYDDFLEQCKKKRNIVFLSDEELSDFNKAVEIMQIIGR